MDNDELLEQLFAMSSTQLSDELASENDLSDIDSHMLAILYSVLHMNTLVEASESGQIEDGKVIEEAYQQQIAQLKRLGKSLNYDIGLAKFFINVDRDSADKSKIFTARQDTAFHYLIWGRMDMDQRADYVRRVAVHELELLAQAAGIPVPSPNFRISHQESRVLGSFGPDDQDEGKMVIRINKELLNQDEAMLAINVAAHECFHCFLRSLGELDEEQINALPDNLQHTARIQAAKVSFKVICNSTMPSVYDDDPEEKFANGYGEWIVKTYGVIVDIAIKLIESEDEPDNTPSQQLPAVEL